MKVNMIESIWTVLTSCVSVFIVWISEFRDKLCQNYPAFGIQINISIYLCLIEQFILSKRSPYWTIIIMFNSSLHFFRPCTKETSQITPWMYILPLLYATFCLSNTTSGTYQISSTTCIFFLRNTYNLLFSWSHFIETCYNISRDNLKIKIKNRKSKVKSQKTDLSVFDFWPIYFYTSCVHFYLLCYSF